MKLLDKVRVLDKGFVSVLSVSNTRKTLKDIESNYYKNSTYKALSKIATATLIVKCPLFVQLYISSRPEFNFIIFATPQSEAEAYIPDISEIGASPEDSKLIKENMFQTTAALLINPKTFQYEGCDKFISQVMTPMSVYNELIVHGSLEDWIKFISKKTLPKPIEQYRKTIEELLRAEWTNLDDYCL